MARKIIGKYSNPTTQPDLGLQNTCTALYVRVSTQLQADEGYSLEAQQERLHAYCTAQGWHVCPEHIYVDAGVSGKTLDRPQFQAMLQAAQTGQVQRIVAMKLDRIARNVREFLATVDQLKAWHCDLVLVKESFDTSTPHGRFALTMFAAMAELEASTITERVMSGKQQKATTGGYNGSRVAYGYSHANGTDQFTVNDEQAAIVMLIFNMYVGGQSMLGIAHALTEAAVPSPTGKDNWNHMTIKGILSNGFYAGLSQWAGTEGKGNHTPLIESSLYDAAVLRLATATRGNPTFGKGQ